MLQQGEMNASVASLPRRCRSIMMAACAIRTTAWLLVPCLLSSVLLVHCTMAVRFSLALVALHGIGIRLLAYVLVTAGSRQICSDLLASLAALYPCALCMLSGVCFIADCGMFAGH